MATRAKPPSQRPPALTRSDTSFYPHEQDQFDRILAKPFEDLDPGDVHWLLDEGEIFIPAAHLRHFAPALAEHAAALAGIILGEDLMERLARVLLKAMPLESPPAIAADLRRAIEAAPIRPRYIAVPDPYEATYPAGHGFARLLMLAAELDAGSADTAAFLESDLPTVQLVVIEHARGIIEGGWRVGSSAAHLCTLDHLIRRLERFKHSEHPMVSMAAHLTLGEVTEEELPRCGDPGCQAHATGWTHTRR